MSELPFAASPSIGAFLYKMRRKGFSVVVKTHGGGDRYGNCSCEESDGWSLQIRQREWRCWKAYLPRSTAESRRQRRSRETIMCSNCGWRMITAGSRSFCQKCGKQLFHPERS